MIKEKIWRNDEGDGGRMRHLVMADLGGDWIESRTGPSWNLEEIEGPGALFHYVTRFFWVSPSDAI